MERSNELAILLLKVIKLSRLQYRIVETDFRKTICLCEQQLDRASVDHSTGPNTLVCDSQALSRRSAVVYVDRDASQRRLLGNVSSDNTFCRYLSARNQPSQRVDFRDLGDYQSNRRALRRAAVFFDEFASCSTFGCNYVCPGWSWYHWV
jgi:hypothetical protein